VLPQLLRLCVLITAGVTTGAPLARGADLPSQVAEVLKARCLDCHDSATKKGGFDLEALVAGKLPTDASDPASFRNWVRVHDRVRDGEMPPKKKLAADEQAEFLKQLSGPLVAAESKSRKAAGRSTLRRLNRTEYENTLRDLLGVPGLDVRDLLPEDGRVLGYDKSGPALEVSTVQINKYLDAADKAFPLAVAPYPERDKPVKVRWYLGDNGGIMDRAFNADAAPLKNFKFDTDLMPIPQDSVASGFTEFDKLKAQGKIPYRGSIGILRNDTGDSWKVELGGFSPVVPGLYRVRISMWGFRWDKGEVKPTTTQVGQLINDQRGLIGSFNAPSLKPTESEVVTWMNPGECLTFRAASVVQALPGSRFLGKEKKGLLGFTSDGIAIDWLEVEGPLQETWPGVGHRRMFGDLPLALFDEKSGLKRPARPVTGQFRGGCLPEKTGQQNQLWTVSSKDPAKDAEQLLANFLPLAFRRPVEPDEVREFAALALGRLKGKVTFEEAMLAAYKAALCSPDFLYLTEPVGKLDDYALASRLSYFLWATMPDEELFRLAKEKKLSDPKVLRAQTERMLKEPRAERFVTDFTNQWLDLRLLDENSPHGTLYPEFRQLLRDSMAEEPRAFFRALLAHDLPASNIVHSDFAMLNQTLAEFYGEFSVEDHTIPSEKPRSRQPRDTLPQPIVSKEPVLGAEFRRVPLPADSQRGGFLTMAAVLKVTANGTTTSPVRRGAWVQRKIVGRPPEPPPPNVPAAEPDTRGLTTIREVLAKHRADVSCAACHAKIDPPGFALESYDAIGGFRSQYRSLEKGDRVTQSPRGSGYGPEFRLGLPVDASGELADGRRFADIRAFKQLLLKDEKQIARNFAEQLLVYATGAPVAFSDRAAVDRILADTAGSKHGIRSLVHAVVQSELFLRK